MPLSGTQQIKIPTLFSRYSRNGSWISVLFPTVSQPLFPMSVPPGQQALNKLGTSWGILP